MSDFLALPTRPNFYLYRNPINMSRSFDSLVRLIRSELSRDTVGVDVFIFVNRPRTMIKVLLNENKKFSIYLLRLDAPNEYLKTLLS